MFIRIVGQQIGFSDNALYTVYDTEFTQTFEWIDPEGSSEEKFNDFLQGFWDLYLLKNKNPMINLLVLMAQYKGAKYEEFIDFLKYKGFEKDNYEKYMVLI